MLKYWRVLLLIVIVLGSIMAIGFKERKHGLEIAYVTKDSPAFGTLEQGMAISSLNDRSMESLDDWNSYAASLSGNVRVTADGSEYQFFVNDSLGIEVVPFERTNLNFGMDLRGGTRIILKPKENATRQTIEQIIGTLQTRTNIYGLKEMKFTPVESPEGWHVQIEATGLGADVVEDLLSSKGSFLAKVSKPVSLVNGRGSINLGSSGHEIIVSNGTISVDGEMVPANMSFTLEGVDFQASNATASEILLLGTVYKGDDIELIYTDPQHSGIVPRGNFYSFYFTVLVSSDGAERFAKVTSGIPSQLDLDSGEYYLKDSIIYLYLDGELQSTLRISSGLGGKAYSTPQIEGGRETMEEATQEKIKLQTILRSGALPVSLETKSISIISPTLGANFIESAAIAAMLAAAAVALVVYVRYRSIKIAVPMVATAFSEIAIIVGISASGAFDGAIWSAVLLVNLAIITFAWWKLRESDVYAWIGAILIPIIGMATFLNWNLDLPAIGGIIAALGTGVDQMVIIADETISGRKESKKAYSLKDKIGRAFYIIFASAAVTISSLVPLLFVTAGVFVRGFVITTIIGILSGILIARPAYAKIVEMSMGTQPKKKDEK